ncbi:hypothetical protein ACJX0J_018196, partial [Zea mays]
IKNRIEGIFLDFLVDISENDPRLFITHMQIYALSNFGVATVFFFANVLTKIDHSIYSIFTKTLFGNYEAVWFTSLVKRTWELGYGRVASSIIYLFFGFGYHAKAAVHNTLKEGFRMHSSTIIIAA